MRPPRTRRGGRSMSRFSQFPVTWTKSICFAHRRIIAKSVVLSEGVGHQRGVGHQQPITESQTQLLGIWVIARKLFSFGSCITFVVSRAEFFQSYTETFLKFPKKIKSFRSEYLKVSGGWKHRYGEFSCNCETNDRNVSAKKNTGHPHLLAPWTTRLVSQWMLHWWRVYGGIAECKKWAVECQCKERNWKATPKRIKEISAKSSNLASSTWNSASSTFLMSRPTFRRDFDFEPTSRKICFRTHD